MLWYGDWRGRSSCRFIWFESFGIGKGWFSWSLISYRESLRLLLHPFSLLCTTEFFIWPLIPMTPLSIRVSMIHKLQSWDEPATVLQCICSQCCLVPISCLFTKLPVYHLGPSLWPIMGRDSSSATQHCPAPCLPKDTYLHLQSRCLPSRSICLRLAKFKISNLSHPTGMLHAWSIKFRWNKKLII